MPQSRNPLAFHPLARCCLAPAFLLVAVGLAGCATPRTDDAEVDAQLKKFTVAPDRAGLFVYRTGESPVSTPASIIRVDGIAVGLTSRMRYVYVDLLPGRHAVETSGDRTVALTFDAAPGSLTYIWEEVPTERAQHLGTRLRLVDEGVGKAGVLETEPASAPVMAGKPPPPPIQTLQVHVEAGGALTTPAIDCEASNDVGRWSFTAPGPLAVAVSALPLRIVCRLPDGLAVESGEWPSSVPTTRDENVTKGVKAGAAVGSAVGVGLAVWSFPIMGPAGALFVLGGAVRGAEVGGLVGIVAPEQPRAYPDPIVVKLTTSRQSR